MGNIGVSPTNTEWLHFALTLLGAACTLVFSFIGWLVRAAVKRAIAQYTGIAHSLQQLSHESDERYQEFTDHREWVRFILAVTGLIHRDGTPNGKRYN